MKRYRLADAVRIALADPSGVTLVARRYAYKPQQFDSTNVGLMDESSGRFCPTFEDIMAEDWIIVQETVSFDNAFERIKTCQKMRREAWLPNKYITRKNNNCDIIVDEGGYKYSLTIADLESKDWVFYEPEGE